MSMTSFAFPDPEAALKALNRNIPAIDSTIMPVVAAIILIFVFMMFEIEVFVFRLIVVS